MPALPRFDAIDVRETVHRGGDDLLTAGLGAAGLRSPQPPAVRDPDAPSALEQRRRAIWNNWRGIADLGAGGGYGEQYGGLAPVPGREFHALLTLPGTAHAHRVMVQVPDDFDADARGLLLTASSGSRGIHGAIAVAGAWALPRGIAVAYTDKGCGCDWFDAASGTGFALDGTPTDDPAKQAFAPALARAPLVAIRHAHSGDNPEARWGGYLRQLAGFARAMLERALPALAPFDERRTRVFAVGLSNGGAAVLQAAADPAPWLQGAVAAAPNVHVADGGRPLYDYASDAALWLAAAGQHPLLHDAPLPRPLVDRDGWQALGAAALDAIARHRLLDGGRRDLASDARTRRCARGWTEAALNAASLSTALDMWRAACVTYSFSYGGFAADRHPLGYRMAMLDPHGAPRPPTASERAAWWSEGSGIVPGAGVDILDPAGPGGDRWPGVLQLRALWQSDTEPGRRVQAGIAATAVGPPRTGLPLIVLHGVDDGLIPEAFSSAPYVAAARRAGRSLAYWRLHGVQHFDNFLALPAFRTRYRPLLSPLYEALDAMWAHLRHGRGLPGDRETGRPTACAEQLRGATSSG
jgi:hydroxybutyrate-dimer hydrolase